MGGSADELLNKSAIQPLAIFYQTGREHMTPQKFKEARIALGLSQSQTAQAIGLTKSTVEKYEREVDGQPVRPVHGSAAKLMGYYVAGFRPPDWPK